MSRNPTHRGRLPRRGASGPVFLLGLFLAGGLAAQDEGAAGATLESMRLAGTESGVELRIISSGTLRLVGVQVEPDGSLAVQLPRHLPGPGVEELFPPEGLVSAVRLRSEQTSRGPLTRVVVEPRQEVAHSVSSEGSLLRLRIWPRGAERPESRMIAELRRQVGQLEISLAESEGVRAALARRSESLEEQNQTLAERFKVLEARRGELDTAMKTTLGEATELLRSLSSRNQELSGRLEQAESRERELKGQLEALDGSLAESEDARRELEVRLETVIQESAELARQVSTQKAREAELEAALAASREEIARLEKRDSALARELGQRLADAAAREDDLRSQLTSLQSALAESRAVEDESETWVQVRGGDDYQGWVRRDAPEAEDLRAEEPEEPAGAAEQLTAQLAAVLRERNELAARLDAFGRDPAAESGPASAEAVPVAGSPRGTTTGTLFLRRGPDRTHDALRVLPRGSAAQVLDRQGYWLRVRTDEDEGWISGRYFVPEDGASVEPAEASASERERLAGRLAELDLARQELEGALDLAGDGAHQPEGGAALGRTTARLNLRRGPGTSYERLDLLPPGTVVTVLYRGETWHRVRVGDGEGWVHGDYLEIDAGEDRDREVAGLR